MRYLGGWITFTIGIALMAQPLSAHHAPDERYDINRTVTLVGRVSNVSWVNPHVLLELAVADAEGERRWLVELGPPNAMTLRGIDRAAVSEGEQVEVEAWVARDGSLNASARLIRLSDGRTFSADPRMWRRTAPGLPR